MAVRRPIVADDPELLKAASRAGRRRGRSRPARRRLGEGPRRPRRHRDRRGRARWSCRESAIRPGHPVVLGLAGATPVIGVPGYRSRQRSPSSSSASGCSPRSATGELDAGGRACRRWRCSRCRRPRGSEEWVRARVGRVGGDLVAIPLRRGAGVLSSLARADGLVRVPQGTGRVDRRRARRGRAAPPARRDRGDAARDRLDRPSARRPRAAPLPGAAQAAVHGCRWTPDGSANGAAALAAGRCHLALVEDADIPAGAITLARWERSIGLMLAPGNPLEIDGIEALARPGIRVTNRQPGSSSRRFLDERLAEHGDRSACAHRLPARGALARRRGRGGRGRHDGLRSRRRSRPRSRHDTRLRRPGEADARSRRSARSRRRRADGGAAVEARDGASAATRSRGSATASREPP